jgi:hypothetical protein
LSLLPVFILSFCIGLTISNGSVLAQDTRNVLTYQVYAGGVHVVETDLVLEREDAEYDIQLAAKTTGWLGGLVPWEGTFTTQGSVENEVFMPVQHQSKATWKGETKTKTFSFKDGDVVSLIIEEEGRKPETPEILDELVRDTTDILSATMSIMTRMEHNDVCDGNADIFDGSRRFTLHFKDEGEAQLEASRYNIYEGAARYCTVEIEPKGGKWHEKPRGWLSIQEQGRKKGSLPSMWMGHVDGLSYAVPVKIMVKTDYGALMMHLVNVD